MASFLQSLQEAQRNAGVFSRTPARMSIVSLDSPKVQVKVQYNPTTLSKVLKTEWTRHKIPGLSHTRKQYEATADVGFAFELNFRADAGGWTPEQILEASNTLESLCYRRKGGKTPRDAQPSRCLFVWPGLLSLTCVITDLEWEFRRFNLKGQPIDITVKLTLEEIRDTQLYAEDVLSGGMRRNQPAPEGV